MNLKAIALIIGGSILLLALVLLMRGVSPTKDFAALTNRELATFCGREAGAYHVHPTLEIVVNGERINVPSNIGVGPTCMTALHTHSPDGLIHVESPVARDFTLGDFFAVWGKPFNQNEILDYKVDAANRIRVTVNGSEVDTYDNTILKDGERIVIYYESVN